MVIGCFFNLVLFVLCSLVRAAACAAAVKFGVVGGLVPFLPVVAPVAVAVGAAAFAGGGLLYGATYVKKWMFSRELVMLRQSFEQQRAAFENIEDDFQSILDEVKLRDPTGILQCISKKIKL